MKHIFIKFCKACINNRQDWQLETEIVTNKSQSYFISEIITVSFVTYEIVLEINLELVCRN